MIQTLKKKACNFVGGVGSPVLANVYHHYALDGGFAQIVTAHCHGEALRWRYADDGVCAFRYEKDAERLYRVLPTRVATFTLQVAPEKTRLGRLSRLHPGRQRRFTFLGFEFSWMSERQGVSRVTRRTARKKLYSACRRIAAWIKQHRHLPAHDFFHQLHARLRGHYQYYGVRGNSRALFRVFNWAMACILKWRNRRGGQRRSVTWEPFAKLLDRLKIARPGITEVKGRRVFA